MINFALHERAKLLAQEKHKGQTDRAGAPYMEHVQMVADITMHATGNATCTIAAYLHDLIEDTSVTREQLIGKGFSEEIVHAVELLSRKPDQDYDEYIEQLKHSDIARPVKMADLIHNLDTRRFPKGTVPTRKDVNRIALYRRSFDYLARNGREEGEFHTAYRDILKAKK